MRNRLKPKDVNDALVELEKVPKIPEPTVSDVGKFLGVSDGGSLVFSSVSSQLPFEIVKKTWTGNGELTNAITFDKAPDLILNIYGAGINNAVVNVGTVFYGSTFLPSRFYDGSNGGNLYIPVTYSNDNKTMTLTFSDAGGAFNLSGEEYVCYYLKFIETETKSKRKSTK